MRQLAQSFSAQAWRRCMSLAQTCTTMKELKPIHAIFVTNGLHMNTYAISKLVAFCSLSGNLRYASLLFDQIHSPNSFIYKTLIRGCARSSQPRSALRYFNLMMRDESLAPDHLTFPFLFMACGGSDWVLEGKQIHGLVVKNGIGCSDGHVRTGLVRFYVDSRVLGDARKVFDEIPLPDLIQWNVMINGYVRFGLASEAVRVYGDMLVCGVEPDEFCVTTGLAACAQAGAFWQGRLIHDYVEERKWVGSDVFVWTALVDMYAKCGSIDMAVEVFEKMPRRNVFSWAAMIGGFAIHGNVGKAFEYLERMQVEDGFRPDGVVLLGVLSACTHAGMVEEGKLLLDEMRTRYGAVPKHEHYSCVVDLLCRAGQLDEAVGVIRNMPMKPLASVWGALLSGCRTHNNVDLAELAVQELVLLGNSDVTGEDGAYVQLSNIYLNAKKSEDASRIRRMMGDRGIKKTPGCSMIEVSGKVNDFVSGDASHPLQARIRAVLELIFGEAKGKRQDPCAIRI